MFKNKKKLKDIYCLTIEQSKGMINTKPRKCCPSEGTKKEVISQRSATGNVLVFKLRG